MTAITRTFAGFLSLLFVFVALSLAGSWHLRHHLSPEAAVAAPACGAQMPGGDLEQRQARISEVRELRFWTTAAQVASLLLCAMVCGIGLYLRYRAAHEARGKEEAERELDRERRALERRVEERTRELRQEVEDRRRAEELNRGQKQVLEMLAAPGQQTTEDILLHLVETVAAQRRSWECSLHLVDLGGKTLQLMASSEVSERLKRYLGSIGTDFPDAPEGRACLSGQTCIVPAMTEVRRPWSELLVANGIFTAWSVPFRTHVSDHVTGTLTVYSRLLGTPSDRDLELVETAAKMAALVIEHRRIHAELVHNAYQDVLTGLPNRRAGEESIQAAISHAALCSETVAVLWIDLNRFKRINDQYGHSAGDHVLRTVANRLRRSPLISGGSARMGGDEFLVLLSGKEAPARAGDISRELGAAIAEPINLGTSTVCVTASIGICSYPHDGTAIDILERNADFAMYRAKSDGAGSCIYSPAMSEEVNEALELEQALVIALEQDQFRLAYQPLYGQDGELFGFEALLRFQHPTLGNISPARFVPVAEETRLILPIGTWVLREGLPATQGVARCGASACTDGREYLGAAVCARRLCGNGGGGAGDLWPVAGGPDAGTD